MPAKGKKKRKNKAKERREEAKKVLSEKIAPVNTQSAILALTFAGLTYGYKRGILDVFMPLVWGPDAEKAKEAAVKALMPGMYLLDEMVTLIQNRTGHDRDTITHSDVDTQITHEKAQIWNLEQAIKEELEYGRQITVPGGDPIPERYQEPPDRIVKGRPPEPIIDPETGKQIGETPGTTGGPVWDVDDEIIAGHRKQIQIHQARIKALQESKKRIDWESWLIAMGMAGATIYFLKETTITELVSAADTLIPFT